MKERKSFYALIGGAILSAILAGSCCLAPLLFLIFGVSMSSLSFLHVLAPYRGYFTLLSVAVLLYLWYDYFKTKRKATACSSTFCSRYLLYLTIGTVLIPLLLTYPWWINYILE
ncbi:MAG TPA: hypothetical protein ENK77_04310 [Epsilonproteobacteria bacterium]|nr:hypothetical protein [Campylobacterota bacterium]